MKTYDFTLIVSDLQDATIDEIYGMCPDSSVGRCHGKTYIAFDRESASLETAIDSAIADLCQLGITPIRIEMDVPDRALVS